MLRIKIIIRFFITKNKNKLFSNRRVGFFFGNFSPTNLFSFKTLPSYNNRFRCSQFADSIDGGGLSNVSK